MKLLKIVELLQETAVVETPPAFVDGSHFLRKKSPGPTSWKMVVENVAGSRVDVELTYGQFDKIRRLLDDSTAVRLGDQAHGG